MEDFHSEMCRLDMQLINAPLYSFRRHQIVREMAQLLSSATDLQDYYISYYFSIIEKNLPRYTNAVH